MIRPLELHTERPFGPTRSSAEDVWSALTAAAEGADATLRALLERDPEIYRAEYWYTQPIQLAVREGHGTTVELLLEAGADPGRVNLAGESLVTTARDRGYAEIAARLVEACEERGRPPAANDDHAVHVAASENDSLGLNGLLSSERSLVERRDTSGATPLHRAVASGAREAVGLLLDAGADIHARHGAAAGTATGYPPVDFEPIDLALWSSPHWAIRGDTEMARLLIDHGASFDPTVAAALGERQRLEELVDEDQASVNRPRPHGKRPLSTSLQFGHLDLARFLLDRGADPALGEGSIAPGGSALYVAASRGLTEMVDLLLDHGADPNADVDSSGSATYAARGPELRRTLMRRGGRLDAYDLVWLDEDEEVLRRVREDATAADAGCGGVLAAAGARGKHELLRHLLEAGARIPERLTACRSYLWSDPESLRILLEAGMDPNLPDWQNATPLHDLCGRDARGRAMPYRIECAKLLLAAGANAEARDAHYRTTALGWAARSGLPDMVDLLLEQGVDPACDGLESWTRPLAWAERRAHTRIAERLRAAGAR